LTRGALRFVSSVLVTTGVLALVDAALTLTWQEPVSAFVASRAQNELADELDQTTQRFARGQKSRPSAPSARVAERYRRGLERGDAVGRIDLTTIGRSFVISQGTDSGTLRRGPGHYADTPLPGGGGTVAVAGHRTTYLAPFRRLDDLERGDLIAVTMPYGRFRYRVEGRRVVSPQEVGVKRPVSYERLVLTACHPLYSASQRIVVFARLATAAPVPTGARSRDSSKSTSATSSASETARTSSQ